MSYRLCAFADEAGTQLSCQIRALSRNRISLLEIRGVNGENVADHTPEKAREINARASQCIYERVMADAQAPAEEQER